MKAKRTHHRTPVTTIHFMKSQGGKHTRVLLALIAAGTVSLVFDDTFFTLLVLLASLFVALYVRESRHGFTIEDGYIRSGFLSRFVSDAGITYPAPVASISHVRFGSILFVQGLKCELRSGKDNATHTLMLATRWYEKRTIIKLLQTIQALSPNVIFEPSVSKEYPLN